MYRVGAWASTAEPLCHLVTQEGFLPDEVEARFVGIPSDLVEKICESLKRIRQRDVVLTPEEPRCLILYKWSPKLLERCEKLVNKINSLILLI